MADQICNSCWYVGSPIKTKKGSILIGALLMAAGIIPGIFYFVWMKNSEHMACPKCGSKDIIPMDTPRGAKLLQEVSTRESLPASLNKQDNESVPISSVPMETATAEIVHGKPIESEQPTGHATEFASTSSEPQSNATGMNTWLEAVTLILIMLGIVSFVTIELADEPKSENQLPNEVKTRAKDLIRSEVKAENDSGNSDLENARYAEIYNKYAASNLQPNVDQVEPNTTVPDTNQSNSSSTQEQQVSENHDEANKFPSYWFNTWDKKQCKGSLKDVDDEYSNLKAESAKLPNAWVETLKPPTTRTEEPNIGARFFMAVTHTGTVSLLWYYSSSQLDCELALALLTKNQTH